MQQQTLVILKPSAIQRAFVGDVITRFQRKGLTIQGLKMMRLSEDLLREHYAHIADRPFFPSLLASMTSTPVIVMCLQGVEAVDVVRLMTGATNSRKALPGTIRGDYGMSGQENIIHASDTPENAQTEIHRFFRPDEIFEYSTVTLPYISSASELE